MGLKVRVGDWLWVVWSEQQIPFRNDRQNGKGNYNGSIWGEADPRPAAKDDRQNGNSRFLSGMTDRTVIADSFQGWQTRTAKARVESGVASSFYTTGVDGVIW
jgi:hypothetical protein